jgi:transcription initiation factor TFIIH subunit 1
MALALHGSLITYPQVLYNQTEGTLIVSEETISFQPQNDEQSMSVNWTVVSKHQVSPATHAKALMKVLMKDGKSFTFRLINRSELERLRRDVTVRLAPERASAIRNRSQQQVPAQAISTDFRYLDPTALAVTRSTLLAANSALRSQHRYLVSETATVSEDDFWNTHQSLVEEEYAKICGTIKAGASSLMQSNLNFKETKVVLGVEEMRQIFILYPAVHKAYEEKVPLDLSDEQFWRKYLESEFFHRDRGRLGTTAKNLGGGKDIKGASGKSMEEEEARSAAVGTDDLFSRYDAKLSQKNNGSENPAVKRKKIGTHLAVGQFDLASTFETERGRLLEGPLDLHPPNNNDDGRGYRVVQKYNRHWAMVLHPDEAVAGSNLMDAARRSVNQVIREDDDDAKANGGVGKEMERLVCYANAVDANEVQGMAGFDDDDYEELKLTNVEKYHSNRREKKRGNVNETDDQAAKRRAAFCKLIAAQMRTVATESRSEGTTKPENCFPPAILGRELLSHLTKRMADDSKTDDDANKLVERLDIDFKTNLQTYFQRSSELLRHFFGLRRVDAQSNGQNTQKLARIVQGLEAVYREMEAVRKALPQNEDGELMRKMCLPIMDQLDWAFQLYRESSEGGSRGAGGFVTVEEL